jgi:hypothetical protein
MLQDVTQGIELRNLDWIPALRTVTLYVDDSELSGSIQGVELLG